MANTPAPAPAPDITLDAALAKLPPEQHDAFLAHAASMGLPVPFLYRHPVLRSIAEHAGSTAGMLAGGAVGAQGIPYGAAAGAILGGPPGALIGGFVPPVLGAAAGAAAGQGYQNLGEYLLGKRSPSEDAATVIPQLAGEAKKGAEAELGGRLLAGAVEAPWQVMKAVPRTAVEMSGKLYGGIKPESYGALAKSPEAVTASAREGMAEVPETGGKTPIGLLKAQAAAKRVQDAIENVAAGAGKNYQAMISWLEHGPESAKEFDVGAHVGRELEVPKIYMEPRAGPTTLENKKVYDHYYNWATGSHDMSPPQAANFLQDITNEIRANKGTGLSAHLAQIRDAVLDALPGEYRYPEVADNPAGASTAWDIKGTRNQYRSAMELSRQLKKVGGSDNPLAAIRLALTKNTNTADALRQLAKSDPEVQSALADMAIHSAGADFAPLVTRGLPRTGLTGAQMILAGEAAKGTPAALVGMAPAIAGGSPRLNMELLNAGRKTAGVIERGAAKAAPVVNPATLKTMIDYLNRGNTQ